ncbi:MAG: hypothetical protein EXX96DRAFT_536779 [Benjaminiella poitrasii]|nr:MAG: hypothetical protein EXX96DRAFT_536779 [Benjaminiella poitrasii]
MATMDRYKPYQPIYHIVFQHGICIIVIRTVNALLNVKERKRYPTRQLREENSNDEEIKRRIYDEITLPAAIIQRHVDIMSLRERFCNTPVAVNAVVALTHALTSYAENYDFQMFNLYYDCKVNPAQNLRLFSAWRNFLFLIKSCQN